VRALEGIQEDPEHLLWGLATGDHVGMLAGVIAV
jgi:hypothetical protein